MAGDSARKTQRAKAQAKQELAKGANAGFPPGDAADGDADERLEDLVKEVATLRGQYTKALQQVEKDRESIESRSAKLEKETTEWEAKAASIAEREKSLLARVETVTALELDAETGFADKEHRLYEDFRAKTDTIRNELTEAAAAVAKADTNSILDRLGELRSFGAELERTVAERLAELSQQADELAGERQALLLERRQIAADRTQLEWDQEDATKQREQALAAERASFDADRRTWEAERDQILAALDQLAERKAELEQRERETKFVDLLQIEADRDQLRTDVRAKEEELARRPPREEYDSLRRRQRELEAQVSDRDGLLDRNQQLASQLENVRSELAQMQLAEVKNENLRREKASLASEVDALRKVLGELTERRSENKPFQLCSAIDADDEMQAAPDCWEPYGGLRDVVDSLKQSIAAMDLYYDEVTIRSFLAGMNSSRLHILQGISGTGKSSLPQAIAAAFGVACPVVEVQAAWRDRQDLLGYFNPFEHRFEETPFTVALYRAQTPRHRSAPFFIVLDEMNLSHPEQYLADVLSAMERPERERSLRLMNHASSEAPHHLRDGMSLPLPPNVWIVGTANHDETTVSFAPKTYDRSHVFELPTKHPAEFEGRRKQETGPVSLGALTTLFTNAQRDNVSGATSCAADFVEGLRPQLASMNVGWGNRIEAQLAQYAPVITGAGGTVREAADVFAAHKILNKLEGRYDIRPPDLKALRETILRLWPDVPGHEEPERLLAILDREEARLS